MKNSYLYIILLFTFSTSFSQKRKIENANKDFNQYSFVNARNAYLEVVEKGFSSQDIYEKLGDSYYFNAELDKASKWYEKLYNEYKKSIKAEYLFRYSQTLKNIGKYEDADKIMYDFNKMTGKDQKRAQLFINKPDYLKLIELQSGKFDIVNLSINSSASDFGPSFLNDEQIVFASSRDKGGLKVVHEWTGTSFLDLFTAQRENKNTMTVIGAEKIKGKINTKLHESSTVFTKDGNTMYFTRNNYTNKKRKVNQEGTTLLKLYKATKDDKGKWGSVVELPFSSDEYSVAHPALSVDESKLYFVSDMPGTKGMSDLYYVDILDGNNYSKPENLGDNINTEGRETFPYINKEGKLFFASDGHLGLGGLDVFIAVPNLKKFDQPYNVGRPINSSADDFTFIVNSDTKIGYFASNRPGGVGGDDIYSFIQTSDLILSCKQYLSGIITDAETRVILPKAKVTLFDENMKEITSTIADVNAKYNLPIVCNKQYVIRAFKEGYDKAEVDFQTTNAYEFKHNQPIQLRKGNKELGIVKAKLGDDLGKLLQLSPIYFDFDKSFIRPDAEIELQKIIVVLRKYPQMEIDVRSHTDSRASNDYNIALSSRRNIQTIKYIVKKGGINESRLTGRGYGERQLTNNCSDGVKCSEEAHQLNRRSEFIITKQ